MPARSTWRRVQYLHVHMRLTGELAAGVGCERGPPERCHRPSNRHAGVTATPDPDPGRVANSTPLTQAPGCVAQGTQQGERSRVSGRNGAHTQAKPSRAEPSQASSTSTPEG
jgi:hypothetical protein